MLIFVEEAVNLDRQGEKSVVSWLRSATMSEVMITLAKEVSNVLSSTEKQKSLSWLILKLCFSPSMQRENGKVDAPLKYHCRLQVPETFFCHHFLISEIMNHF